MKAIGLMKGDVHDAVVLGAHAMFFQCGLGHMIGLDVHDMENLGEQYVGYTDSIKKSAQFGHEITTASQGVGCRLRVNR